MEARRTATRVQSLDADPHHRRRQRPEAADYEPGGQDTPGRRSGTGTPARAVDKSEKGKEREYSLGAETEEYKRDGG